VFFQTFDKKPVQLSLEKKEDSKEDPLSRIDSISMVLEYLPISIEQLALKYREIPLKLSDIKCIMFQIFSALDYLHKRWIIHRVF